MPCVVLCLTQFQSHLLPITGKMRPFVRGVIPLILLNLSSIFISSSPHSPPLLLLCYCFIVLVLLSLPIIFPTRYSSILTCVRPENLSTPMPSYKPSIFALSYCALLYSHEHLSRFHVCSLSLTLHSLQFLSTEHPITYPMCPSVTSAEHFPSPLFSYSMSVVYPNT